MTVHEYEKLFGAGLVMLAMLWTAILIMIAKR